MHFAFLVLLLFLLLLLFTFNLGFFAFGALQVLGAFYFHS